MKMTLCIAGEMVHVLFDGKKVTNRYFPLCPPDAWHSQSGYTMSEKAAMLFEYDQKGMRNLHVHYPDASLFA